MRLLVPLVFALFLSGCNAVESDLSLHETITMARDSVNSLKGANEEGIEVDRREELLETAAEQYADAKEGYAALIKQTPEDAVLYNNLGWLQMQHGDKAEAEKNFTQALSLVKDEDIKRSILVNQTALTQVEIADK